MPSAEQRPSHTLTWVLGLALLVLPLVWLPQFLFAPQEEDAAYLIGRWSLLAGGVGVVALVAERVKGVREWAAAMLVGVAWVGVLLGKVLASGEQAYRWLILSAAVVALLACALPMLRSSAARVFIALGVLAGLGQLTLA